MKFDVDVEIFADAHLIIEADTAEAARSIADALQFEVDLFLPEENIDDSEMESLATHNVIGVSPALNREAEE